MKKQSALRQLKRKILREKGLTFTERARAAAAKGTVIQGINWTDKPDGKH